MIRRATPGDDAAICAIINDVIARPDITFRHEPRPPSDIAAMRAVAPVFVAEHSGRVVGYATWGPFRGGSGYASCVEHSIAVAPDGQGQGIGRALMDALIDAARAEGFHTMVAGVSGLNPKGRAFHAALGFVDAGVLPQVGQKDGKWQDLVLMVLRLDDRAHP